LVTVPSIQLQNCWQITKLVGQKQLTTAENNNVGRNTQQQSMKSIDLLAQLSTTDFTAKLQNGLSGFSGGRQTTEQDLAR